jgi:hypothetical protein
MRHYRSFVLSEILQELNININIRAAKYPVPQGHLAPLVKMAHKVHKVHKGCKVCQASRVHLVKSEKRVFKECLVQPARKASKAQPAKTASKDGPLFMLNHNAIL